MSSFRRPTSDNDGDAEIYGSNDVHVITDMLNGAVSDIPPVKFKSSSGVTFWDSVLKFRNQADTFTLTLRNPDGLTQDRELSLPAVTSNDVLLALNLAQTPTNKTIVLANNIVTDTSAGTGDVIVHNGTKFVRLPAGTTSQFLRGDGTWQLPPGAGGGEANTGSNVGTATGKVYKQNSGTVLQFKSIGGGSSKISTTNDTDDITLDVAEGNLTLDNLGGTLGVAKGGTGATTFTAGVLKASGTSAFTTVAAPASAIVGLTDAQILTTKTINATNNTITDTDTDVGDLLKSNGTKFVRLTRGTAGQVLKVNSAGDDIEWGTDLVGEGGEPGGGEGSSIMDDFASGGIVWGWHYPHGIIGGGMLNNVASDIVEQNVSVVYSNTADKGYGRRINGVDAGSEGLTYYGKVSVPFRRERDCFVDFWMQLNQVDCRVYAFFTGDASPASTSDSPLDSETGFGIMATLAGNFRRVSNDGSGTQQLAGTDLFTKDSTYRHIRIESDTTNSRWTITVNGSATHYTYASIDGPAASTPMWFCFNVDESGGSVDQTMDIYKFKCGYKLP